MKLIIDILIKNIYHQLKILHYTVKTRGVDKKNDEKIDKIYLRGTVLVRRLKLLNSSLSIKYSSIRYIIKQCIELEKG